MAEGTFLKYAEKRLGADRLKLLGAANQIIESYETRGYSLTLRQLYYQFVARGLFANKQANYDLLGNVINDGRMAGLVSWTAIEDRTRGLRGLQSYSTPAAAVREMRVRYRRDKWETQPWRPEVWVEKDALVGVIQHVCNELGVDYFACRGYNSQSEQWRAGMRLARYVQKGQRPIVFHLGDHDPSGIDMTRDNQERLSLFAGTPVIVARLALNMNQVEQYNPPPNPAKLSDSRAPKYVEQYGDDSWELDALEPEVIAELIRSNVLRIREEALWAEACHQEAEEQEELDKVIADMEEKYGATEGDDE
jgi:hypothetical protein